MFHKKKKRMHGAGRPCTATMTTTTTTTMYRVIAEKESERVIISVSAFSVCKITNRRTTNQLIVIISRALCPSRISRYSPSIVSYGTLSFPPSRSSVHA